MGRLPPLPPCWEKGEGGGGWRGLGSWPPAVSGRRVGAGVGMSKGGRGSLLPSEEGGGDGAGGGGWKGGMIESFPPTAKIEVN